MTSRPSGGSAAMAGRRCVVTGAASGIGDSVARALLAAGGEVVAVDRFQPTAPVHDWIPCDLAEPESVDQAVSRLGRGWDVLCNVAGVPGTLPAGQVLRVNFLSGRQLSEGLLPEMNDGGAIVNVASITGARWRDRLPQIRAVLETAGTEQALDWYVRNRPDVPAYTFSKELVIGYSKFLAERLRQRRIRVNSVSPGSTDTPMLPHLRSAVGPEKLDRIESVLGRHARPDEIAPAVAFLCSPDARWISGHDLVVDGGYLSGATFRRTEGEGR